MGCFLWETLERSTRPTHGRPLQDEDYSLYVKEWKGTLWRAIWGTTLFWVIFHSFRLKFASFSMIFHAVLVWNPSKRVKYSPLLLKSFLRKNSKCKKVVFFTLLRSTYWFGLSTQINCHQGHVNAYAWVWSRVTSFTVHDVGKTIMHSRILVVRRNYG